MCAESCCGAPEEPEPEAAVCECGTPILLFPCSGGDKTGQLANQAAVELTAEGRAKLYCLAGLGARLENFITTAEGSCSRIAVDGCKLACASKILEAAGVPATAVITVTELGIAKEKDFMLRSEDIAAVKSAIRAAIN